MVFSPQDYESMRLRTEHARGRRIAPPDGSGRALITKGDSGKEADLHNQIISYCKSKGWVYFHSNMAKATRSTVGQPDFTLLADDGRVYFIECKTAKGKLAPEQEGLRRWAFKLGHIVHVCRSFEQFREIVGGNISLKGTINDLNG